MPYRVRSVVNAGLMELVVSLLLLFIVWGAIYWAVRLGVRHAMRDARSDRDAAKP